MYVLMIARGCPSAKYKMNGIFEFDQARILQEAGIRVVYAAVDTRSLRRWRRIGLERNILQGIPCYILNIPLGRVPHGLRTKIRVFGLKKLFRIIQEEQGRPEVIHAHFIGNGYISGLAFQKEGIPLVLTEHFRGMNQKTLSEHYWTLGQLTYPRMDRVLAVSSALAHNIRQIFGVPVQVVPNAVDVSRFSQFSDQREENKDKTDSFRFVSAGGLTAIKRMDLLIRSFHSAFSRSPNITLTIFGEGPMRKVLEEEIRKLELEQMVFLKGLVSRGELAREYAKSDAFVLASESETFGLAYAEAMAAGLPVIATESGGPEQFVNKTNGIMVPVNEEQELTRAFLEMRDRAAGFDRVAITSSIQENYSPERLAERLRKIYLELTS